MTVRGNLPAQITTFIGRQAVLADTEALLGKARLVTLVGASGAGKSRVAVETGRVLAEAEAFQHGVWRVRLADLKDPALLARTVATELRIVDNSPAAGLGRLVESLHDKHLLLLLDNCEHLLEAVRHLVHHLLRDCEGLTILTTSREPIGVYGEHLLRVPPLSEDEAVRLFLDRAPAEVDLAEAGAVCRAVDGLPLAIELVAAAGIAPIDALESATLERVFEWAAHHCTDEERRLWALLSVFPRTSTTPRPRRWRVRTCWSRCPRWFAGRSWWPRRVRSPARPATGCWTPSRGSAPVC